MPSIHRFPRSEDDSDCPPAQPFCASSVEDLNSTAVSVNQPTDATTGEPAYNSSKYAGLIIALTLVGIFFLLWLTWAEWPRKKAGALWRMRKGRKKEDKGIHSPEPQTEKDTPSISHRGFDGSTWIPVQHEFNGSAWVPLQDGVMVDLNLDDDDSDFEPEAVKEKTEAGTR